ncbi:MAG: hypothetical protein N2558_03415 [Patescibacteria group bacterium]|nr:hypothetical protein [Patescibacteria group bacterium]
MQDSLLVDNSALPENLDKSLGDKLVDAPRFSVVENLSLVSRVDSLEKQVDTAIGILIQEANKIKPDSIPPMSHAVLSEVLELTRRFYGGSKEVVEYLLQESHEVAKNLLEVPGVVGVAGLGYPFYVITEKDKSPISVPEIYNFLDLIKSYLDQDMLANPDGWICPRCQMENQLPDLKTFCKPCKLVNLKPRDIFRAVPDLDVVTIVDNPTVDTELKIQEVLKSLGYIQSDINIRDSVERTRKALLALNEGSIPDMKVPVDVHIWRRDEVLKLLDLVSGGEPKVFIRSRALHSVWEDHDINFWVDFVFSFTSIELRDEELAEKIASTRRFLKGRYTLDQIIDFVAGSSPRFTRLLSYQKVRDVLKDRIESW